MKRRTEPRAELVETLRRNVAAIETRNAAWREAKRLLAGEPFQRTLSGNPRDVLRQRSGRDRHGRSLYASPY